MKVTLQKQFGAAAAITTDDAARLLSEIRDFTPGLPAVAEELLDLVIEELIAASGDGSG